ncbi:hypothetical protein AQUCO_00900036v1 [Aquilegia coerulea]|uniref:Non-structural maintenance of chromosomes element 4 n=1 Tax=Aquilegia coerulea TaxID=218851 RepID=A0A2G5EBL3_AQUCA|nr:hypothetical protein AQUCO_00900036v1 [Aquilegia coerulea]
MERFAKREPRSNSSNTSRRETRTTRREEAQQSQSQQPEPQPQPRDVNRDPGSSSAGGSSEGRRGGAAAATSSEIGQDVTDRRVLRSKYLAVKHLINDERENISGQVSDKFKAIINEVESLHHLVQKPREQIADAEALLDIANTILSSVKSQSNDGITPSDFITSLLREFPPRNGELTIDNLRDSMAWGKLGGAVSHILKKFHGCSTMLGPMNVELKQRKIVQRKRVKPAQSSRPEEIEDNGAEEKTDTDKNMATMFNIVRKKRSVKLEHLVLNRISFAQTVENLFALSFLVKDGRVAITVNDDGHHLVWPRNAPAASAVASGDVSYSHFVFRFDFKDWKVSKNCTYSVSLKHVRA